VNYLSGETVMVGDIVRVTAASKATEARVIAVLAPGSAEALSWNAPEAGSWSTRRPRGPFFGVRRMRMSRSLPVAGAERRLPPKPLQLPTATRGRSQVAVRRGRGTLKVRSAPTVERRYVMRNAHEAPNS
jgi:hypothetical protein